MLLNDEIFDRLTILDPESKALMDMAQRICESLDGLHPLTNPTDRATYLSYAHHRRELQRKHIYSEYGKSLAKTNALITNILFNHLRYNDTPFIKEIRTSIQHYEEWARKSNRGNDDGQ